MSSLVIRMVIVGIGAAMAAAAYFKYRSRSHINDSNAGPQGSEPKSSRCSVCLNDFRNFSRKFNLPCGHALHRDCAELLFVQRENSCPSCRRTINPEFLRAHFMEI